MRLPVVAAAVLLGGPAALTAQHTHSPYAAGQSAEVKTLTAEEVASIRAGEGMGLAKPAELNAYPGPRHVLDLADSLDLTTAQRERTRALFEAMTAEAIVAGDAVIEAERELDALFASGSVDPAALDRRLAAVADARAALAAVHLRAHLAMRDLLTRHQVHEYVRLRGYDGSRSHGTAGHGAAPRPDGDRRRE
jgi:Spy/CpxP family protein refolding chaperone